MGRYIVLASLIGALVVAPASAAQASDYSVCTRSISVPTGAIASAANLGNGYGFHASAPAKRTLTKSLKSAKRTYARAVRESSASCKRALRAAKLARNAALQRAATNSDRIIARANYEASRVQRQSAREAAVYRAFDTWAVRVNAAYGDYDRATTSAAVLVARTGFRGKFVKAHQVLSTSLSAAVGKFAAAKAAAKTQLSADLAAASSDEARVAAWDRYTSALDAARKVAGTACRDGVPVFRAALSTAHGEYDDDLNEIENEVDGSIEGPSDPSLVDETPIHGHKHPR